MMSRIAMIRIICVFLLGIALGACNTEPRTFDECVRNNMKVMKACDRGACRSGDQACRSRCARDNGLHPPMDCIAKFGSPN